MAIVGEVHEITKEVEWRISDFLSLSAEIEKCYNSPSFLFAGEFWYLRVYPTGRIISFTSGYISVYLCRESSNPPITITCSVGLKTSNKEKDKVLQFTNTFNYEIKSHGVHGLQKTSELMDKKSKFVPSGTLTIVCTVKYSKSTDGAVRFPFDGKEDKTETGTSDKMSKKERNNKENRLLYEDKGLNKLSDNFRQIFLDGRLSDVVLKLDDREFNVHKTVLVARSPIFAFMFEHDLAEKKNNVVDIPDCSPESFEVLLHYLYSGRAETMSTSNVYNVYYAADKYQVDELKEKCVEFMTNTLSVETFCDVIALALRHRESELQKTATDFFSQNIKKIIKTVQWQEYMDKNSTHANELFIKALNA